MDPEKVVVREIRVSDRELADSLYFEIENGLDFEEAATLFSRTNPSRGGLKQPFSEGKYNDMGHCICFKCWRYVKCNKKP